ncbi:MAG: DUF4174 domain-containing protein [Spirochaetales bacterium]|nr:DUF4174 domain-containing protein [Spirochaetales bacterium]
MMTVRKTVCALLVLVTFAPTAALYGQALDLEQYRGESNVLVVLSSDTDDPRVFSFNLALSAEWNRVVARNMVAIDVDPAIYDVEAVARQLGLADSDFAVVLIAADGEIIFVSDDPTSLPRVFRALDIAR